MTCLLMDKDFMIPKPSKVYTKHFVSRIEDKPSWAPKAPRRDGAGRLNYALDPLCLNRRPPWDTNTLLRPEFPMAGAGAGGSIMPGRKRVGA